jgi:hypothetical protein
MKTCLECKKLKKKILSLAERLHAVVLEIIENPENYKQNFKDKCAMCGCKISDTWEHYKVSGNYCGSCNSKCQKNANNSYKENKKRFNLK